MLSQKNEKKLFFFINNLPFFWVVLSIKTSRFFLKVKTKLVDGQKGHLDPFGRVWTLFGGKSVQRERMKKNWTKPPAASYGRIFKFLVSRMGFLGSRNRFPGSKTRFEHSDRRASS